ncbi:hypothetical protein [Azospirillum sp.]|uniref:hypothetical protein n=1 Tax=Azospirillum sp. TaxID=34012 RepID=UPI003D704F28
MTRKSPITLGTETFPTQAAAVERLRGILNSAVPGATIAGTDAALLHAVLAAECAVPQWARGSAPVRRTWTTHRR